MAYNFNFYTPPAPGATGRRASPNSSPVFARVVNVILENNDPSLIGSINYRVIGSATSEESPDLPIAYPSQGSIKKLPLKGEIVVLESLPDSNLFTSISSKKVYYTRTVDIWNHPSYNGYPDEYQPVTVGDLGRGVIEPITVNPLLPFQGDMLIEGRQGQSIRFTGFKSELADGTNINTFVDDKNNGKPLIIISNDQISTDNGFDHIKEDVNEDSTSIYLTSDHVIPLEAASNKRDSYNITGSYVPENFDTYRGSQLIANSGRIVLNSKEDSILLSATRTVGLNGQSINLDGEEYIALHAPNIYLGLNSSKEKQPVLLGTETVKLLKDLVDLLRTFSRELVRARTFSGESIPKFLEIFFLISGKLNTIEGQLDSLKSKKVWVE